MVGWHEDRDVSGGRELGARPGLTAALLGLRDLSAGLLVVAKRDRLARKVAVAAAIESAVDRCGARIVSADGVGNGDDDSSHLLREITDVIAAHERRIISTRTKAALDAKRARGERVGECPFGWTVAGDGRTLVEDDDEQRIIASVLDLRADGLSFRKLAAELARRGVTSPRSGRPLSSTQVHRIVRRHESEAA